jgi:hypothetical protein
MARLRASVSTAHIPTLVDVDVLNGGSARLRDGGVVRSMAMKMDYLGSANAAIRDYNEASAIAEEHRDDLDLSSSMDVMFRILGSRLNDIAIRASELEDPVLIEILRSIGMVKGDIVSLIQMGDEGSPSELMAGLGPTRSKIDADEAASIAAAVRLGVHHEKEWTLAMPSDQTKDLGVLAWIADCIQAGDMDSEQCPKALVGKWKLYVRARP